MQLCRGAHLKQQAVQLEVPVCNTHVVHVVQCQDQLLKKVPAVQQNRLIAKNHCQVLIAAPALLVPPAEQSGRLIMSNKVDCMAKANAQTTSHKPTFPGDSMLFETHQRCPLTTQLPASGSGRHTGAKQNAR